MEFTLLDLKFLSMDNEIEAKNAPILVPSPNNSTVRVFPDEWKAPLRVSTLPQMIGKRDLELEYRIVRFLTEDDRMHKRLYRNEADKDKNRYRDMVPFVENRVLLPNGAYINASYMVNGDGRNKKAYIASQGPLKSTIGAHWEMIEKEHIKCVLTIGKLSEGTTEKIALYWPESAGDVMEFTTTSGFSGRVKCLSVSEVAPGLFQRLLFVSSPTGVNHEVTHHHFVAWPDHGSLPPETMILLASLVKAQRIASGTSPVLVHCSAGVGRTGSVLAIANCVEIIENQLKENGGNLEDCWISILGTVLNLRECRVHIVERTWQYESLYAGLAELALKHDKGSVNFVESLTL